MEESLPLLEAASNTAKAILAPLPRFITGPCCSDPAHATNCKNTGFKDGLKRDLVEVANFIREVLNNNGIRRHRVLNVNSLVLDEAPERAWKSYNEPSITAYGNILKHIYNEAGSIQKKTAPDRTTGHTRSYSESGGQQRPETRDPRPRWSIVGPYAPAGEPSQGEERQSREQSRNLRDVQDPGHRQ